MNQQPQRASRRPQGFIGPRNQPLRTRRRNQQRQNRNNANSLAMTLSGAAMSYAASMANPFTGPLSGVPSFPAMMTRKAKFYTCGSFQTGTQGFGWIVAEPFYAVANNQAAVYFTTAAYTDTSSTAIDYVTPPTGLSSATTNSDYVSTQFGTAADDAVFRVVSAGVRVRYSGTEVNRGGIMVGFHDPNHKPLQGSLFSDVNNQEAKVATQVDDKMWTTVLWKPVDTDEMDFQTAFPSSVGVSYPMGVVIVAEPTSNFQFEAYFNYEISGRNVQGKSLSPVDITGFNAVHNAIQTSSAMNPQVGNNGKLVSNVLTIAGHAMDALKVHSSGMSLPEVWSHWNTVAGNAAPFIEKVAGLLVPK